MLRISILLSVLLSACEQWPPQEQEVKDHFHANEADISLLREKLLDSKYLGVGEEMQVTVRGFFYEGELVEGTIGQYERPADEAQWLEIFNRSGIDHIGREFIDSTFVSVSKDYFAGVLTENIFWSILYVHDPALPNGVRACGDKNPNVQCGSCISNLAGDWWLQYSWSPTSFVPEAEESWLNGEISDDEYDDLYIRAREACFADSEMLSLDTAKKIPAER